ncbi:MAG: hypothetical protein R3E08_12325 [Thiotrichaceae bacterium]
MQSFQINQAQDFKRLSDLVLQEPVQVINQNSVIGVLVNLDDYQAMRLFYADRLRHTLKQTAENAQAAGLTEALLNDLLADES